MTCIPLHKFGRWTYFGWTQWQRFESSSTHHFWDTPQHFLKTHFCLESVFLSFLVPEQRWLAYHYTQLGRWTYCDWTQQQRFESSSTHHFWDTPQHVLKTHFCLESGFLLFLVPEQRWLAYHYTQLGRRTYFGWTQWQRFDISSIHHFWDTPQHFLKTHLCLERGFFFCLELHKFLLVSFEGYWTQWQRFESSSTHHFWDTPQHFLKTRFCLESGFLSCLELQKSLLVNFQGCWTQWQKFVSSSTHHLWDTLQNFSKHIFA